MINDGILSPSSSSCLDVTFTNNGISILNIEETCVLTFPGPTPSTTARNSSDELISIHLTMRCDSSSRTELYCPQKAGMPCFTFVNSVVGVPGVNVSVSIIGCTMYRAAVEYNIMMGTLRMENVTLNGMGTHLPLNVFNAMNVTVQNSNILNGANTKTTWMGGGCVSLRGVRVGITMFNTTVRQCVALHSGGCVYINGDNYVGVKDHNEVVLPPTSYGGLVHVAECLLEYCVSQITAAGSMSMAYVNSIQLNSSVFRHSSSKTGGGCLGFSFVGDGNVTFTNNVVMNCTAEGSEGCMVMNFFDDMFRNTVNPVYVQDSSFTLCKTKGSVGGVAIQNTYREVVIRNLTITNASSTGKPGCCGCLHIGAVNKSVTMDSVLFRNCSSATFGSALHMEDVNRTTISNINVIGARDANGSAFFISRIRVGAVLQDVSVRDVWSSGCLYVEDSPMVRITRST
eukprot:PhF_6_TR34997/c1_g3_i10/m.50889